MEAQGYIEEYYGEERCFSGLINTPGVSLLSPGLMGVAHFLFLIYLFLGISISADIFMEAIEVEARFRPSSRFSSILFIDI